MNAHHIYDFGQALFQCILIYDQVSAVKQLIKGDKLPSSQVSRWYMLFVWTIFNLYMYVDLEYWWAFITGMAVAGGNLVLVILMLIQKDGGRDEENNSIRSFDSPPEIWEGRVYYNKQTKKMYTAVDGQWIG